MGIFDDAHAVVFVADHIAADAKLSALGAFFTVTPVGPGGLTSPCCVAWVIDVPSKHVGQEYGASLELRDTTTGSAVQIVGPSGQAEALRIQQLVRVERPSVPGAYLPEEMFCRQQMVVAFGQGLGLTAGHFYRWSLQIDGQHRPGWTASFHVLGPSPLPVIGGPLGSSTSPTFG